MYKDSRCTFHRLKRMDSSVDSPSRRFSFTIGQLFYFLAEIREKCRWNIISLHDIYCHTRMPTWTIGTHGSVLRTISASAASPLAIRATLSMCACIGWCARLNAHSRHNYGFVDARRIMEKFKNSDYTACRTVYVTSQLTRLFAQRYN